MGRDIKIFAEHFLICLAKFACKTTIMKIYLDFCKFVVLTEKVDASEIDPRKIDFLNLLYLAKNRGNLNLKRIISTNFQL